MQEKDLGGRQPLRWYSVWRMMGWAMVAGIIYLSLGPPDEVPVLDVHMGDKISHLSGYFIVMGWFAQLQLRRYHLRWLVGFIAMGIALEFIQGQTGYRQFEYADMLANSLGALFAWALARGAFARLLLRFEQYCLPA